jgi:hypothetical protein
MQVIVSDSSCLIDLRKAALLDAIGGLPYEVVIPDALFEEELLKFTDAEKSLLLRVGLKKVELPGEGVLQARTLMGGQPRLSIHDCFALTLAERTPGSVLLAGDGRLRTVAAERDQEVRGVLWILDEMNAAATAAPARLLGALELFASDPAVFRLPAREVYARLRRYKAIVSGNDS